MSASHGNIEYLDADERRIWMDRGREDMEIELMNIKLKREIKRRKEEWTNCPVQPVTMIPGSVTLALLGLGGSGKSSTGNLLVNRGGVFETVFETGAGTDPQTEECKAENTAFENQAMRVLDTPGYLLSKSKAEIALAVKKHAKKMKELLSNGVHVLIVVLNLADPRNIKNVIDILERHKMLNTNSLKYCMVVGTHGKADYSDGGIRELLTTLKKNPTLQTFLGNIKDRVVIIDASGKPARNPLPGENTPCKKEKQQAREMIMNMVRKVLADNNGALYTHAAMESDMSSCFPAHSLVHTATGKKNLQELCIGDAVLTSDTQGLLQYQPVIMFIHATNDIRASFIVIHTTCGKVLRISAGHLLQVKERGKLLAARDVQVGDVVFVADSEEDGNVRESHVTAITSEQLTGIYCPHTVSGSIIVDGVLASCYTDLMPPAVAHGAMFPIRTLYRFLPHEWFIWILPYNKRIGMPCVVERLRTIMMPLIQGIGTG